MKRLMAMFAKRRIARDLDDELRTHLELLAADYERQGMAPEEARLAARLSTGNLAGMKEEYRDARGVAGTGNAAAEYALRGAGVAQKPGVHDGGLVRAGPGNRANSAIYRLADVILLRPLQIANLDRVVNIVGAVPGTRLAVQSTSPGDFADFRDQSRSVENIAAWYEGDANMTGSSDPQRILAARVTTSFFDIMQVQPLLGRLFRAAPDSSGLPHTILLSYRLWRTSFGVDPGVTGERSSSMANLTRLPA
jgi:MacB-like periplasmic core domain